MTKKHRKIFFLLFALSGFSGLIYESIWSHYIKLFLGHSAYAQTLVMIIFMGGMSIGSWICCRYSLRWKNLLLYYAAVEAIIGVFALVFHNVFDSIIRFSYYSIIPQLPTPSSVVTFQWLLSAMLILPQSILIGMPFPLMSAGIMREFPKNPGRSISGLYFLNSIGASIGVLVSGFLLIRMVGLPGTIRFAGAINILIAMVVWSIISREKQPAYFTSTPHAAKAKVITYADLVKSDSCLIFLFASFITGASSFIYEISWLRMLSLVLGSTTHAFELMLSAFILGLALGALWIKRRLDNISNPVSYLIMIQLVMGSLAIATLPLYNKSFDIMQWILKSIGRTDNGYMLFNISSHAIAMAVMLPATICAGMTLPLITYILLKKGHGEGSIGAVYAANTIGAILGMSFAVQLGMPFLGLKGLISFGACLDIALGLFLIWKLSRTEKSRLLVPVTAICICSAFLIIAAVRLNLHKMDSGVYLNGNLFSREDTDLLYHKDGKTATVSVTMHSNGFMSLRTNGKSDAAINLDPYGQHSSDEDTMVLTAVIPMALNPNARTVANIGLGAGLTTHTLLSNHRLEHVDTIEIEEAMIEASKKFGEHVKLALTDPRSKIHIDDAKSFFSAHNEKYDIIISEPSHPWVSGIANLFTDEFYSMINNHMATEGLFVQWLQLTDTDLSLVASVVKAISSNFSDYALYAINDATLLIVSKKDGTISNLDPGLFNIPEIAKMLRRIYINNISDIEVRKIGNKQVTDRLIRTFPVRPNSDYYPVLDQNAVKARFLNADATDIINVSHDAMPVVELLSGQSFTPEDTIVTHSPFFSKSKSVLISLALRDYFLYGDLFLKYGEVPSEIKQRAIILKEFFSEGNSSKEQNIRMNCLYNTAIKMVPYLKPAELEAIWNKLESGQYAYLLTKKEKNWIMLFRAIGKRDTATMASMAKTLLETEENLPPPALQYLVASGMIGSVATGDRNESNRLWAKYNSKMSADSRQKLLFRLVLASNETKSRF